LLLCESSLDKEKNKTHTRFASDANKHQQATCGMVKADTGKLSRHAQNLSSVIVRSFELNERNAGTEFQASEIKHGKRQFLSYERMQYCTTTSKVTLQNKTKTSL